MNNITNAEIRSHLHHGEGSRRVRIKQDGSVHYYGSREDTDREHGYWHDAGTRAEIAAEIVQDRQTEDTR